MWIEVVLICLTLYILWQSFKTPDGHPPGPWGLPIIGYIPIWKKSTEIFKDLNKTYGDVVSFRIGTKTIVAIFDFKLLKEAFSGPNIADRPSFKMLNLLTGKTGTNTGVIGSNGAHWVHLRRFSLRHLRDLGMGKSKMVLAVQHEATELVNDMKRFAGQSATLPKSINIAVLNVIWQMVASKRYRMDDEKILNFERLITSIQDNVGWLLLPDMFPWLKFIIPRNVLRIITNENTFEELSTNMIDFLQEFIDDHIKNLDANDPKDYIDAYLVEMENQKDDPSSLLSVKDLMANIADLFAAGSESTASTLEWVFLYLATHPEVQSRLQQEIDEVLPKGTLATLEDKPRLPYTDAFMQEIFRTSSLAPNGLFHLANTDTKLGDYLIPKVKANLIWKDSDLGFVDTASPQAFERAAVIYELTKLGYQSNTIVLGCSGNSHYNSKYFESPNEFRPERFLNSDGKFVYPKEGFFPFGIGKRQCLGEALARMEVFIFLTTIVQNLNFAPAPGTTLDLRPADIPIFHFARENQKFLITTR